MAYSDIDSGKVLNKEGLLELCGQIKTEIANSASSSGATYTAGSGIDIDANGAINNIALRNNGGVLLLLSLLGLSIDSQPYSFTRTSFNRTSTIADIEAALQAGKGLLFTASPSVGNAAISALLYKYGIRYVFKINDNGTITSLTISNNSGWATDNNWVYYYVGNILIGYSATTYLDRTAKGIVDNIYYNNTTSSLSATTVKSAIDELAANKQDAIIPSAPAADGSYKLTSTVASGASTYSWATDTSGATYTAGAGINIDANNEISSTLTGLPAAPGTAGTYMLKCVKSVNSATYSWEEVTVGGSY